MLPEQFALLGSLLASAGGFYYLYCTIKGTVQPNKITWFFWGAFPMIAFAAQLAQGVGFVLWATFAAGFTPFLIVLAASFNKEAYWEIKRQDYLFAAIGIIGVVLWQVTDEPNLALTFALIADLAVAWPTIAKSFTNPETEDWKAFAFGSIGFLIALLSVQVWTYENYAFVGYLFVVNTLIMILAARKSTTTPEERHLSEDSESHL